MDFNTLPIFNWQRVLLSSGFVILLFLHMFFTPYNIILSASSSGSDPVSSHKRFSVRGWTCIGLFP